jgi:hypothetical protein
MVKDCNLGFTLIIFYKYHVLYGFEITWLMNIVFTSQGLGNMVYMLWVMGDSY